MQLHAQIEIAAPPQRVWEILTDFSAYGQWNPVFERIRSNSLTKGKSMRYSIRTPEGRLSHNRGVWQEVAKDKAIAWSSVLIHSKLYKVAHRFELNAVGQERTLLVHTEQFTGLLASKIYHDTADKWSQSLHKLNQALTQRVSLLHKSKK